MNKRLRIAIAEDEPELAAGSTRREVEQPVLRLISKRIGAVLVCPLVIEGVPGQHEQIRLVRSAADLRMKYLCPRAPAEEVKIGNQAQSGTPRFACSIFRSGSGVTEIGWGMHRSGDVLT